MTLYSIINILKSIAKTQPNVRTATDGSVYDKLNTNPSVQYDVFHIQQTTHTEDFETDYYGLQLFYISRLEDSLEDNRLQIQSIGKEVLGNIIRTFCENFSIDYPTITYIPFTQRFVDLTAGVYCNVRLEVPKDLLCADDYIDEVVPSEKDIRLENVSVTITENGTRVIEPSAGFDGIGMITIYTDVPNAGRLEYKEVEYTENGEYTIVPSSGYDGISEVAVTVDVPATEDRYEEGYEDGEAAQKAKLVSTSFTANNTYTRVDGWSSVTVNVPATTAYTDQDLIANLQGDYFVIPSGTTSLRSYAFYNTCFSSITIPNTVTGIDYYAFGRNPCLVDITIPSSVQWIAPGVFQDCSGLTAMTFEGLTPPSLYWQEGVMGSLGQTDYTFPIYVPCQSLDAYKTAFGEYYAPRIQCIPGPTPPPASGTSVLDFVYETTEPGQTITLFIGDAQTDSHHFWNFYNCIDYIEIDGAQVQKSQSNISYHQPDIAYYWHTFPSAGTHSVKFYVPKNSSGQSNPQYPADYPGITVLNHLFVGPENLYNIRLKEANIGENYRYIGAGAFQNLRNLTALTLPGSLTGIGWYICENCTSLTSVTCLATTPPTMMKDGSYPYDQFKNCTSLANIYVPAESVEAYKAAAGWSIYANIITAITS